MNKGDHSPKGSKTQPANTEPYAEFFAIEGGVIKEVATGFRCLREDKGFTIVPFQNPSGKWVPRLKYTKPGDKWETRINSNPIKGCAWTLREADALRKELAEAQTAKANDTPALHTVLTSLTDAQVREYELARPVMLALPSPDWNQQQWTPSLAFEFIKTHFRSSKRPIFVKKAADEYYSAKEAEEIQTKSLSNLKRFLNALVKQFPNRMLHEISDDEMDELINSYTGSDKKEARGHYRRFFKYAMAPKRSWTNHNPAATVEIEKVKKSQTLEPIFDNANLLALLREAQVFAGGGLFLYVAIGFSCALRKIEMVRITARLKTLGVGSFHFGALPGQHTINALGKTRRERPVQIPAEYAPLIQAYVEAGYPVIPMNFERLWTELRARIKFLGQKNLLPPGVSAKGLIKWAQNVHRHTGATHHLARCKNAGTTAFWMGNTEKMVFSHYWRPNEDMGTDEFYLLPSKLKQFTVEELKAAGVPPMATDVELRNLDCPVDSHKTFLLTPEKFMAAREAYLVQNPQAAIPEPEKTRTRRPTRKTPAGLPSKEELTRQYWTTPEIELAVSLRLTRRRLRQIAKDLAIDIPQKGDWQKRAAGKPIVVPETIRALFPNGLPPYRPKNAVSTVIKRKAINCSLWEFFQDLWHKPSRCLAEKYGVDQVSIRNYARKYKLPAPKANHWKRDGTFNPPTEEVQQLLLLSPEELNAKFPPPPSKRKRVSWPTRVQLFRLLWMHSMHKIAKLLGCHLVVLRRQVKNQEIPAPEDYFWIHRPEHRRIPDDIKHLLSLSDEELAEKLPRRKRFHKKVLWPSRFVLFHMLWEMKKEAIGQKLGCSNSRVNTYALDQGLEAPPHGWWSRPPEKRQPPEAIQYLLSLTAEELDVAMPLTNPRAFTS